MILSGKLEYPWKEYWYQFKDWHGNPVYVPATVSFTMFFSIFTMIKAVIYFNIPQTDITVNSFHHILDLAEHLSYLMSNCSFFLSDSRIYIFRKRETLYGKMYGNF